jgi:hypothetical protein
VGQLHSVLVMEHCEIIGFPILYNTGYKIMDICSILHVYKITILQCPYDANGLKAMFCFSLL